MRKEEKFSAIEVLKLWIIFVHGYEEFDHHRVHILTDEIKRTNNSKVDTSYEGKAKKGF